MRGFGCWLNKSELETYIKYINEVPFWNNMFHINPNNKNSYTRAYGPLNIHSDVFKPRLINLNLITDEKIAPVEFNYSNPNYKTLTEQEYNINRFKSDKSFNKKYNTINTDTGYIEPLDKDIITINTYNAPLINEHEDETIPNYQDDQK